MLVDLPIFGPDQTEGYEDLDEEEFLDEDEEAEDWDDLDDLEDE